MHSSQRGDTHFSAHCHLFTQPTEAEDNYSNVGGFHMGEFRRSTRSASGFRSEQVTLPRSFCLSHITFFCLRVFEHTIGEDAANRQTFTPTNYLRPDDMILRTTTRTYKIDNPMWKTTPGIQSGNQPPHFTNSSMIVVWIPKKK